MWASEAGLHDDDPREIQRRREAYARELDHQIALRRARQHQEQMEREELERKLAPRELSPSKWLVEGGHLDTPATSQPPWKFTQSVDLHNEQRQDRGAATGEANSVSSSHPRFRVTDESETSQRLRERAQQMQWKRILDEQVQEKARLKEQEEAERRHSEEEAAKEEMRYLREQQLRAQRRLGHFSPALSTENRTETSSPYHTLPSPPDLTTNRQKNDYHTTSDRNDFPLNDGAREDDTSMYYQRDRQYGSPGVAEALLPPPAPSRISMPQDNGRSSRHDGRDTFDRSTVSGIAARQQYFQDNDTQASRQQLEQQSRIIDEYRSLLAEIRREREELRRERDEVRREKEELRVQRALLQLENEKMATLVDAQRALNEQHQADLQEQQAQQAQQQAQHQHRVIKSRGFYDFEQELKSEDRLESFASGSVSGSVLESDLGSSFYGDDDGEDDEDDLDKHDNHSADSRPAANSGLFGFKCWSTSNLKGKEKKIHEAKKIEALGGKAAKNRSVPYKILIGLKTKGAARKQRREELRHRDKDSPLETNPSQQEQDETPQKRQDLFIEVVKKEQNHFGDDQTNESPLDLDAMVSMGDFEKYIAEN
ncbi:Endonuclease III protein 1 [Phytophthora nicotianae]|uniref:Endonuclease III protein 1 n=1 Tax=Phytophthora nicotianae TaxID=4792 RepID=A0A0W8DLF6_PHYNI|nr:Endonuclease III protein 1 [Phytophthora nicotianae]